ncbi:hypothetical protein [uncultured Paludibaculum sp.]|uniref:hypothetical protein n=1 Tax=uncultured Paludibaculum sp. TaxID=1765020 RepID=UPI002AAC031D|nr:hypothetical protein [uncultured Paludibaculum sp.]
MHRRLWTLALAAALASPAAFSADKPNLTGTWNLNVQKSEFGPSPGPDKFVRKIEHKDPELKMTTIQAFQGQERTNDVVYTIDGTEHTVKSGQAEAQITATWKGNVLEVKSVRNVQGNEIVAVETWTLAEDGKTLSTVSHIKAPMGELDLKFLFEKE